MSTISASTTTTTAYQVSADTTGALVFQTGATPTTALTIDTGQRSKFPTTIGIGGATPSTSGAGITFPATQSASSDANTLDDYEEGTFTPVLTASGYTFTFGSQSGLYTKIGNCVTFKIYLVSVYSSGSGGASGYITGLPFTSSNLAGNYGGCSFFPDTGSSFFSRVGVLRTNPNTTQLTIGNGWSGSGIVTSLNWATSSTIEWEISGQYFTA